MDKRDSIIEMKAKVVNGITPASDDSPSPYRSAGPNWFTFLPPSSDMETEQVPCQAMMRSAADRVNRWPGSSDRFAYSHATVTQVLNGVLAGDVSQLANPRYYK